MFCTSMIVLVLQAKQKVADASRIFTAPPVISFEGSFGSHVNTILASLLLQLRADVLR